LLGTFTWDSAHNFSGDDFYAAQTGNTDEDPVLIIAKRIALSLDRASLHFCHARVERGPDKARLRMTHHFIG
jgi:hypothetical protein